MSPPQSVADVLKGHVTPLSIGGSLREPGVWGPGAGVGAGRGVGVRFRASWRRAIAGVAYVGPLAKRVCWVR